MRIRFLPPAVLPLLLLLAAGPVVAQDGSLSVSWDPSPDPQVNRYRVDFGTNPASLNQNVVVPAPQTSVLLTGLQETTLYHVEITALTSTGCESAASTPASATSSNAGPRCQSVQALGPLYQGGGTQTVVLQGGGFEPGADVSFSEGLLDSVAISVESLTVVDGTEIRLTVSAGIDVPAGAVNVTVRNLDPDQPPAPCQETLEVLFNPQRADVDGSGRVEGVDLARLATIFGAFDRICAVDSPNVAARGLRCDGEDDCGGAPGPENYCTRQACVTASPESAGVACRLESDCGGVQEVTALCEASPYAANVDMNSDGLVDGEDLSELSSYFGQSTP